MAHLFDTNTFLRLAEKKSPQSLTVLNAIRSLRNAGETLYYTPQIVAEFWNVCTRPASSRGGLGLSVEQTERKADLLEKYFTILHDNPATFAEWRGLVSKLQIKGVQVHDAKLVASMIAYNIPHLVTFNVKDFARFIMINVIDPNDV